jgi:hypothetical protein
MVAIGIAVFIAASAVFPILFSYPQTLYCCGLRVYRKTQSNKKTPQKIWGVFLREKRKIKSMKIYMNERS